MAKIKLPKIAPPVDAGAEITWSQFYIRALLVAIAMREEGTTLRTGCDERMEEKKAEELTNPQRGRALS